MRFVLSSSLHDLAGSRWLQQRNLHTSSTACRHQGDDDHQGDEADQSTSQPKSLSNNVLDVDAALNSFHTWAQQLQEASILTQQLAAEGQQQLTAPSLPLTPHQQLLRLAEALQQAAAEAIGGSTEFSRAAAVVVNNRVPLCKALKQLASATEALWTAAAEGAAAAAAPASPHQAATAAAAAAAGPPLNSPSLASRHAGSPQGAASRTAELNTSAEDHLNTAAPSATTAAAVDGEGLKQLLFWACHLTVVSHKVYQQTLEVLLSDLNCPAVFGFGHATVHAPHPSTTISVLCIQVV
jgi:hypothetical protein